MMIVSLRQGWLLYEDEMRMRECYKNESSCNGM